MDTPHTAHSLGHLGAAANAAGVPRQGSPWVVDRGQVLACRVLVDVCTSLSEDSWETIGNGGHYFEQKCQR
jgi:hypothetical protein